ncbi:hypothetical protein DS745_06470 [Anaerobacillus alkaliphilus]|uniref:Uncharacterized protein n=1 Tax=Anaerobacillus alkaliphilus TaxID=1548597 RepID=A0A4Q0VVZ4_9BACI|nr:DUF6886 family protein [Anaerobacillus alkaliphilus]RXJ02609.1 hypothetical protein DS745_06470 [Anaerobacillus alkaliphilus]
MRLFHVSEEKDIELFQPRVPTRKDLDPNKGLVWALHERCLPNFLTPRNCPRVTFHCNEQTTVEDKQMYLSSATIKHVIAIEHKWFEAMKNTTLYLYEFDPSDFYLQDESAGYYVSEKEQTPINQLIVDNLYGELIKRNVEIRLVDQLWDLSDKIQQTSFAWSMCRMGFAEKK